MPAMRGERSRVTERSRRNGKVVQGGYLWLIHVDVWQKPTQYCKAIIPQLKINKQTNKQTEVLAAGEKT